MEAFQTNNDGLATDEHLVRRILQGEKALFEILMRRYNQSLYRVIRSYFTHDEDVEDAMQEAYLKAYEKLQQFRGASSFSTWLIRIGINEALMRIRANRKHTGSLNAFSDEPPKRQVIRLTDGPEQKMIQYEMRMILEQAIDKLPEKYRVVYVMKEVEDMKAEEIAACLNITENNVKVRLHRAKALLKESLYRSSSGADVFTFGNARCDLLVGEVMRRI